jgi:hypothetical protein
MASGFLLLLGTLTLFLRFTSLAAMAQVAEKPNFVHACGLTCGCCRP